MLIFNTTYLVSDKMYGVWFKWLHEHHIPFMTGPGYFHTPQVAKVLADSQQEGTSYSVQFHISDMKKLELWNEEYGREYLDDFSARFGEEVLFFSTVLEVMS